MSTHTEQTSTADYLAADTADYAAYLAADAATRAAEQAGDAAALVYLPADLAGNFPAGAEVEELDAPDPDPDAGQAARSAYAHAGQAAEHAVDAWTAAHTAAALADYGPAAAAEAATAHAVAAFNSAGRAARAAGRTAARTVWDLAYRAAEADAVAAEELATGAPELRPLTGWERSQLAHFRTRRTY